MPRHKWRFRMYREIGSEAAAILDEVRAAGKDLGLPAPPEPTRPRAGQGEGGLDRILEVVKARYGDAFECCIADSPVSGLWVACRAAFAETRSRHGLLPRCIAPRQKRLAIQTTVLPPKYRHLHAPLQHTAHAPGFDMVLVPLHGAEYWSHGVVASPASLLTAVNPEPSLEALAAAAESHAPYLAGFFSQGQSTPGCGFGPQDERGVHLLYRGLAEVSSEFDVPYVVDNTPALPLLDEIPATGSSITVYGHGALGAALLVGTEDLVLSLIETCPPPPDSDLAALADLMTHLLDEKDRYARNLSRLSDIVSDRVERLDARLRGAIRVREDLPSLAVEVNYEDTWRAGMGLPIFTYEDSGAGTNLLKSAIAAMGITSATVLEASISVHLPPPDGGKAELDEDRATLEVRGLVAILEILGKRSGYLD